MRQIGFVIRNDKGHILRTYYGMNIHLAEDTANRIISAALENARKVPAHLSAYDELSKYKVTPVFIQEEPSYATE